MTRLVDLHTHTTASDGQYAPSELIDLAKNAGIEVLAVTNHDTLNGLDEAVAAGKTVELTVLRGVELSAAEERHLHILGLGIQSGPSVLAELCQRLRSERKARKYRIVDFLAAKGVPVSLPEVEALAGGAAIGRPHFARVMLQHGWVSDLREAFDKYLDTDEFQKIERFKPSAKECINAIHDAGGRAVLAHPYQLGFSDGQLENRIKKLRYSGLDGLECYYPKHTPEQVEKYLALARKYDLHLTAGSDFHGERVKPEVKLTPVELDVDWLLEQ